MKMIFFTIIIVVTTLTSCVVESFEKPKRTIFGYNISEHVSSDIRTASLIADITRIVDMWYSATTELEKFDIEDKYFGDDIKLRQYGDGITIVGYYDFKTLGKPLLESKWRVTPLNNQVISNLTYEISLTMVNECCINILNRSNAKYASQGMEILYRGFEDFYTYSEYKYE